MTDLNPGDVLLIGQACSVQFAGDRALRLRLVSAGTVDPYTGWVWLTGYVLNDRGTAVDKREVFVMRAGIRLALPAPTPAPRSKPTQSAAIPNVSQDRRPGGVPATPQRRAAPGRRTPEHR